MHGVTRTLGGGTEMDQRPARPLGDLSSFSVSRIRQKWLRSLPTNPPPGTAKVIKWLERSTWGEVRAVVLKSNWEARCDLLHNNVDSRNAATALASSRLHQRISSLAYRRIPSRLHLPTSVLTSSRMVDNLNRITWGRMANTLLHDRHTLCPPA